MKVHWEYRCDFGHDWSFYREEDAVEEPGDDICPYGHQAVVLRKLRPVDKVQITLRPASVLADTVTGQIAWERHYWFILSDIDGQEERRSKQVYLWRDVLGLAERFQGRSWAYACELWDKMKL
jgi:hypothetical protein